MKSSRLKSCSILLLIISLNLIFPISFNINTYFFFNSNSNDITIKVKGIGSQKICGGISKPNLIYKEGTTIGENTNQVTLDSEETTLILQFNDNLLNGVGLFSDLTNLLEVDLSGCSFSDMASMFNGCNSLTSINFSGVDTSNVHDFFSLFNGCEALISVDLSNLSLNQITDFGNMFDGCKSLEYINIGMNYDESAFGGSNYIQLNGIASSNLVICFNQEKAPSLLSSLDNVECKVIYCGDDNWKKIFKKFDEATSECVENYYNDDINGGETHDPSLKEQSTDSIINEFEREEEEEKGEKEKEEEKKEVEKENEEEKEQGGENKVDGSRERVDDIIIITSNYYSEKVEFNGNILKYFFNSGLFNNTKNITEGKRIVENIIDAIKEGDFIKFMSETNETQLVQKSEDKIYQVSTLSSQLNNNDIASINLGDCETKLRNSSNINPNEDLIIFKINYIIPETNTQILEYTIFTQEGVQLNLDICKDTRIEYNIPIDINEKDLFKYDPKSEFYNDICFQYTTDSGTDMSNYDRKNEFNAKHSLCENTCEFKEYNKDNKKVVCDCKVKNVFNVFDDINKKDLLKKFSNFKNIFNLEVVKCTKLVFSKKGLISNIGSYIVLSILFINIINTLIFLVIGYKLFLKKINKAIEQNNIGVNIGNNINNIMTNQKRKDNKDKSVRNSNNKKSKTTITKSKNNKKILFPPNKRNNTKKRNKKHKSELVISKDLYLSENKINDINSIEQTNNNIIRNDFEMNSLSYQEAQQLDSRSFFEYYKSLIITKQSIAFSFFTKTDYNSRLIKINLFFTSFALYYAIKALFFNDNVMHVIYQNRGVYDFLFQLPQIIYSTIISTIIGTILSKLSLTQGNVVEIKNYKKEINSQEHKNEFSKFIKCIRIKIILFFIINYLLIIIFWYYLSCFCSAYKNTQVYLIKDVLISFGISLIYPFIINIFPAILRINSLKEKNNKHKYMYTISKILQLI